MVSNRLLPLLASAVGLMLLFVTLQSCPRQSKENPVLADIPQAPVPDADTPADTIKTLTANVAAMAAEVNALRQDNEQLRTLNQDLASVRLGITDQVTQEVTRAIQTRDREREAGDQAVLLSLHERIEALSDALARSASSSGEMDYPVGGESSTGLARNLPGPSGEDHLIWHEPLEHLHLSAVGSTPANPALAEARWLPGDESLPTTSRPPDPVISPPPAPVQSVHTVPRNATLMGATALTALVGRVPIRGEVQDPMPFKVITGADNLAANGLRIPGVHGMVWSGTAIGDWTLSCVTGRLDSVTFVFDDGTIRTVAGRGPEQALAWISDDRGIPCITGERKTNASAFLTQQIALSAVQAAAEAAAQAETTLSAGPAGHLTRQVSGHHGTHILGKTIAGSSEAVTQWLLERQAHHFDAVFVPSGTRVVIHVDQELSLDFDPTGRKILHDAPPHSTN